MPVSRVSSSPVTNVDGTLLVAHELRLALASAAERFAEVEEGLADQLDRPSSLCRPAKAEHCRALATEARHTAGKQRRRTERLRHQETEDFCHDPVRPGIQSGQCE
jgi:hypothetical protein